MRVMTPRLSQIAAASITTRGMPWDCLQRMWGRVMSDCGTAGPEVCRHVISAPVWYMRLALLSQGSALGVLEVAAFLWAATGIRLHKLQPCVKVHYLTIMYI